MGGEDSRTWAGSWIRSRGAETQAGIPIWDADIPDSSLTYSATILAPRKLSFKIPGKLKTMPIYRGAEKKIYDQVIHRGKQTLGIAEKS